MHIIPPEAFADLSVPDVAAWCGSITGILGLGWLLAIFL
jgi:hypothetical protein